MDFVAHQQFLLFKWNKKKLLLPKVCWNLCLTWINSLPLVVAYLIWNIFQVKDFPCKLHSLSTPRYNERWGVRTYIIE